jgi:hypothetical protein
MHHALVELVTLLQAANVHGDSSDIPVRGLVLAPDSWPIGVVKTASYASGDLRYQADGRQPAFTHVAKDRDMGVLVVDVPNAVGGRFTTPGVLFIPRCLVCLRCLRTPEHREHPVSPSSKVHRLESPVTLVQEHSSAACTACNEAAAGATEIASQSQAVMPR